MFPSSAILEEMFPSDRDGNNIRRRYAISAIPGFKWRKGDVEAFSGDGVQMKKGKCCDIFWRSGFNQRRVYAEAFSGVQMKIGVEECIRDEVLRIIFCSCVTLDSG